MKKVVIFMALGFLGMVSVISAQTDEIALVPLAGYDYFRTGDLNSWDVSAGLALIKGEQDIDYNEKPESTNRFSLIGMYSFYKYNGISGQYPDIFHSIDSFFDWRYGRHQLLLVVSADAEKPFAGGMRSFQAGAIWGYELVRSKKGERSGLSLILGGGIAAGDFGITLPSGNPLPVIPVPLIRFNFKSPYANASFDFITGPNLNLTIAPESRFRLTGDFRMDQLRDVRDIIFETVLWYRFFKPEHPLGDFAGLGIGFKNDGKGFAVADDDQKTYEQYYNSIFGVLDISVVKVEAGFVFNGIERYHDIVKETGGHGFFVSIQAMLPFSF
jgi:hypothetical protein